MQSEISNRRFEGIDTDTVAMTDYRRITDNVYEVVVSTTGHMNPLQLAAKMCKVMNESATPVHGSFRWLKEGVAVGFVSTSQPPRLLESEAELSAYKHVASNMYMDATDESLWELRNGAGGKYLARKGSDELPDVLASVRKGRSAGIPSLSSVQRPQAQRGELVCFVNSKSEVDYAFAIGKDKQGNIAAVAAGQNVVAIDPQLVVTTAEVEVPPLDKLPVLSGVPDASAMIAYWSKVFFYAPEYLSKWVANIREQAAA